MKRSEANAQKKNDSPWKENSCGGQDHCGEPWQSPAALSVFCYTTRWEQTPGASLHTERKGRIRAVCAMYDIWLSTTLCNRILDFLACRHQTVWVGSPLVRHQRAVCSTPSCSQCTSMTALPHINRTLLLSMQGGFAALEPRVFFLVIINIRS